MPLKPRMVPDELTEATLRHQAAKPGCNGKLLWDAMDECHYCLTCGWYDYEIMPLTERERSGKMELRPGPRPGIRRRGKGR